jgi:hypothetical protein
MFSQFSFMLFILSASIHRHYKDEQNFIIRGKIRDVLRNAADRAGGRRGRILNKESGNSPIAKMQIIDIDSE